MSGGEIVIIVLVFLLLFGSKAIPDVARTLGKAMREFQKATDDIKREINESGGGIGDDISDIRSTIQNARSSVQEGIRKHTGDIVGDLNDIKSDINKGTENITKPIYDQVSSDYRTQEGIHTPASDQPVDVNETKSDTTKGTENITKPIPSTRDEVTTDFSI